MTINALEANALKEGLKAFDESRIQALLENEKSNPFQGKRCSFLLKDGSCGIYELRPIVCRSHGAPIQFKDEEEKLFRDVCPLNFTNQNIGNLHPNDVMNLDTINSLLALLLKFSALGEKRTELKPSNFYP
jgi:Fe-S-cluster containining protein